MYKSIIVIGCGGIGGWLAQFLTKTLIGRHNVTVTLVDGDVVEERNLIRQNFTEDDIDKYKAEVLAKRYGFEYINSFVDNSFNTNKIIWSGANLVIVAVDTIEARKTIFNKFSNIENTIIVDSGVTKINGQIIVLDKENMNVFIEVLEKDFDPNAPDCVTGQNFDMNLQAATILNNAIVIPFITDKIIVNNIKFTRYSIETKFIDNVEPTLLLK